MGIGDDGAIDPSLASEFKRHAAIEWLVELITDHPIMSLLAAIIIFVVTIACLAIRLEYGETCELPQQAQQRYVSILASYSRNSLWAPSSTLNIPLRESSTIIPYIGDDHYVSALSLRQDEGSREEQDIIV